MPEPRQGAEVVRWCSSLPELRQGAQVVRWWCGGGAVVVFAYNIYNKVETKYNLFISVKNSIKYEFILFFIW